MHAVTSVLRYLWPHNDSATVPVVVAVAVQVGDFCALVNRAEVDGHLRSQLQALLKLPKEKWDEAADHARKAVVPDSRMRAWLPQTAATAAARHGVYLGLLFPCKLGVADIKRPVGEQ